MSDIETLLKLRAEAKRAYYEDGEPIMTDKEYDELEYEILGLDPTALSEVGSPVGRAGANNKTVIDHKYPMLSMAKCKTIDEVVKWMDKINYMKDYHIGPKVDGLSCECCYIGGILVHVCTRGDGKVGQLITDKAKFITSIPKKIGHTGEIRVRGELYLPKNTKYDTNGSPLRNCAVGLINRKDKGIEDCVHLKFVAYQVISEGHSFGVEANKYEWLEDNGFFSADGRVINSGAELKEVYEQYLSVMRSEWEYETDGLVITVNDISKHDEINSKWNTDHHNIYNMALKPPSEGKKTIVTGIEWNVSRFGNIIPTLLFTPVNIGGANIGRATLNNYDNVIKMKFWVGDQVLIERANDVIPFVAENLSQYGHNTTEPLLVILDCPSCGTTLNKSGVHMTCDNPLCPETNIQKMVFWTVACEMDGISEETIRTLYNAGLIKISADLYALTTTQVLTVPGFKQAKTENLLKQIDKTRTMTTPEFVVRLGIPLVGEKAVKKMGIKTAADFIKYNDQSSAIGRSFINFREAHFKYIQELRQLITLTEKEESSIDSKGTVCMTGAGPKPRKQLVADIESLGYTVVDSVTKDTNILLCEDPTSGSSKLVKAEKLGVKLVSYDEFFRKLEYKIRG